MTTIAPDPARVGSAEEADDAAEDGFKPWSAEQAQQWRAANPPLSPWPVVGVQAAVGLMAVAVAWPFDHHLYVVFPCDFGEFSQGFKLGKLRFIVGIVEGAWA